MEKIFNQKSFNKFFLHLWVVELTYICHRYKQHQQNSGTGVKICPVSLTPVENMPPVSLILVVNLDLQISPQIFNKI
jgi:hypothetical protein